MTRDLKRGGPSAPHTAPGAAVQLEQIQARVNTGAITNITHPPHIVYRPLLDHVRGQQGQLKELAGVLQEVADDIKSIPTLMTGNTSRNKKAVFAPSVLGDALNAVKFVTDEDFINSKAAEASSENAQAQLLVNLPQHLLNINSGVSSLVEHYGDSMDDGAKQKIEQLARLSGEVVTPMIKIMDHAVEASRSSSKS